MLTIKTKEDVTTNMRCWDNLRNFLLRKLAGKRGIMLNIAIDEELDDSGQLHLAGGSPGIMVKGCLLPKGIVIRTYKNGN